MTAVCVAGATGWTGSAVARGVLEASDLELRSGVSRSSAGQDLGRAWGGDPIGVPVAGSVAEALDGVDVLVDFTSHAAVLANVLTALRKGVAVVVGSSGLSGDEYAQIDRVAREHEVGVVAAGNFSLTAALAQASALLVAPYLPQAEIIDYASATKRDAPSGTARELAERLSTLNRSELAVPLDEVQGVPGARGAVVGAVQVHSLRLPSFSVSTEVVFGLPDERLSIRHDAGSSAAPYVSGTLLAIRAVGDRVGLTRGLDTLLLGS
jgi:4-hydroxy-tetrahydrodipicolinate reductase